MPTTPTPVVCGLNWHRSFDELAGKTGIVYLPRPAGGVRGGHAVCLKPPGIHDPNGWWEFYNQGTEGACVGFASSRMMSLLNRERYDGFALYHQAQRIDEWDGENYDGTSVRAGMDVLRNAGPYARNGTQDSNDGIRANRWAGSVEEIAACLSPADAGAAILNTGYVLMLNSWGRNFPHLTRIDLDILNLLIFQEEQGEATVVVDR